MAHFDLSEFLRRRKEYIVGEWVRRLSTEVGDQYAQRPLEELFDTVGGAFDANYDVLVHGRYDRIHKFINRITLMRLETGFPLSHVQKAFELYRSIVVPLLADEAEPDTFLNCILCINDCLAVTIHRFSDYFQEMHQSRNLDYARRLEEEVRVRTAELREAEHMADVGRITTSLSHEIRNPLSAVQLNLQILKKNKEITGNDARRLDIAVREVGRLEGILKELLDFAKPLVPRLAPCRFETVIETCLELLEPKFHENRLKLKLEIEDELPRIMADREKIGQALINLLLNAIDVTPEGGAIELSCRRTSREGIKVLEATVADSGPGVRPEQVREVFKPFFTTKTKGTGLGLTNVKRIVEAHQGWVHASNLEPSGAQFKIWLPLGED